MRQRAPLFALLLLFLAWAIIATLGLADQYSQTARLRKLLAGKSARERAVFFDSPSFLVTEEIAALVPSQGCVVVLAHAGRAAIDYYRPRFRYELYPRRVHVFDDTAATVDNCPYLAVFRDSRQNLRQSPFTGSWNQDELDRRSGLLRRIGGEAADVYGTP